MSLLGTLTAAVGEFRNGFASAAVDVGGGCAVGLRIIFIEARSVLLGGTAAVCLTCGLPDELCLYQHGKSRLRITIQIEERRYGKEVTIVKGLDAREINLKRLASALKSWLACGGTTHQDAIERQGNHCDRIESILVANGLAPVPTDQLVGRNRDTEADRPVSIFRFLNQWQ